ncbi:SDR family NAD(P)-dependent oxidoreductase [Sphaerisporangium sp. TRM90804]|uniref:SDR family NAD(P)-dependent oxidoreductase n=1 Tax=Sphaerisporangium sp. TRM90804 TaxID=3031113 RepID=UPI002447E603|nr:SDR family NAD(P)-dependent oxidoreductase [Sphaerisporangium sp. TRM90804]MDH2429992.1 SDR family NAD(P)-dependent oxidoreductase [Sphaerisporangium sp. TRM90804]
MRAFDLSGRTALVTGASRGIGRAIAIAFAEAGADVALVARSQDTLAEVAKEVEAFGRRAYALPCDLTDRDAAPGLVQRAIESLGHLDIVVNNAGGSNFIVPFKDLRLSGWDKLMRLNLDSTMAVCHAVAPHLLERGSGSVINVASVAALGAPFIAPYAVAKAGVVALTKSLALEWASAGVRVNALCPGWTATELNRPLWEDENASRATIANVPMGRWGTSEEMAPPAVFLASQASAFVTGQVLFVDGGLTAT